MNATWILTALIPLSLMLVIGLIVLSGAMPPARRRLLERGLILVVIPAAILLWAARGVQAFADREWVGVASSVALVGVTVMTGLRLWRRPVRADGTRT